MNRHEIRRNLVISVYQHLVLKKPLGLTVCDNYLVEDASELDDYVLMVVEKISNNEEEFIADISGHLKKWSFDRLNYVEQAILLVAKAEIALAVNDRKVIINEAIILAKEYCDDESFKYINGVLDQL